MNMGEQRYQIRFNIERVFSCYECSVKFKQSYECRQHIFKEHKIPFQLIDTYGDIKTGVKAAVNFRNTQPEARSKSLTKESKSNNKQFFIGNKRNRICPKKDSHKNETFEKLENDSNNTKKLNLHKNSELFVVNSVDKYEKAIKAKYDEIIQTQIKKMKDILEREYRKKYDEIKENILENEQKREKLRLQKCKTVHKGIKCDKCSQNPIVGFRYKCSVCKEYNLCEKCEELNSMSEEHLHNFIKIKNELKNYEDNPKKKKNKSNKNMTHNKNLNENEISNVDENEDKNKISNNNLELFNIIFLLILKYNKSFILIIFY